jgi:ADP-ribose pyrophosphatase YjhB (NUDIX family)
MLLRPPPWLHRLALKLGHGVRMAWWRVRRPTLHGCNAIVANAAGEVLLVRHSYQTPRLWMLPGGGLERGERPEDAAVRELREETGCTLFEPQLFGTETVPLGGARNIVHLVAARTEDAPRADGREIVEAAFFGVEGLPSRTAMAARRRIARWRAWAQNSDS